MNASRQVMVRFERKRRAANEVSYHVRFTSLSLAGKMTLSVRHNNNPSPPRYPCRTLPTPHT